MLTEELTSATMAALFASLNVHLAPCITRHGVLVEVYGEGILILGDSGVGKSETAIELVKRGHRLIADDAVEIKRVSKKALVGSAPEILRHYVELRGIGIIDVKRLYGISAVKDTEKLDLVINLESWIQGKMYDRLGLDDQTVNILGIELPEFEYIARTGKREGYLPPVQGSPYAIELAVTKEELISLGVKYAIGASHWRVDSPYSSEDDSDKEACIREWHRQQLWLAADERVTILGHPWFHGKSLWYEDFDDIPRSMKEELSAALLENKKHVELNAHFYRAPLASEKFRYQYAEYMREMFEMGIPVVYGSDSHKNYHDQRDLAEVYLEAAGFKDGDIGELSEADFWC